MKDSTKEAVGTYLFVGVVSLAGAALWDYVLERKWVSFTSKIRQPKSEKIIDFKKAKKRLSR